MHSTNKAWFSPEVKRAGRISAAACIILFALLTWGFRGAGSRFLALLYPADALSLGAIAVSALNWRRWHNFRDSLAAAVYSVVACFQFLGFVILPLALLAAAGGNPLMVLAIFIFYLAIPLGIYFVIGFPLLVGVAGCGGAVLYGLLMVMKKIGNVGEEESPAAEYRPRPLRMLV